MFKTQMFGYKKMQVDKYINDLYVYINTLRGDIDELKKEINFLKIQYEKLENDKNSYIFNNSKIIDKQKNLGDFH